MRFQLLLPFNILISVILWSKFVQRYKAQIKNNFETGAYKNWDKTTPGKVAGFLVIMWLLSIVGIFIFLISPTKNLFSTNIVFACLLAVNLACPLLSMYIALQVKKTRRL